MFRSFRWNGQTKRWSNGLRWPRANGCPTAIAEFDVGGLVRKKVSEYPIEKLEALVLSVAKQHLKTIELFGAVIGFFIGVAQAIYFWLTYHPGQ